MSKITNTLDPKYEDPMTKVTNSFVVDNLAPEDVQTCVFCQKKMGNMVVFQEHVHWHTLEQTLETVANAATGLSAEGPIPLTPPNPEISPDDIPDIPVIPDILDVSDLTETESKCFF